MQRILGLFLLLCAAPVLADGRNPVGETAKYQLDKRNGRTSSMIKSGNFLAEVEGVSANTSIPSFDVAINYEFDVAWVGNQSGTEMLAMEQQYFTEEFLEQLRVSKHYESAYFKVDHKGFADAVNMDGNRYDNCDKLFFYDIKTGDGSVLAKLLTAAGVAMFRDLDSPTQNSIENMTVLAHVEHGNPVIGAVKLDLAGKYRGVRVKAGGDYIPQ